MSGDLVRNGHMRIIIHVSRPALIGGRLHAPTLGALWCALPATLTAIYAWTAVVFPVDLWHRLASGRQMWRLGALVTRDSFTYTIAGHEIHNQNWLAELALYRLFELGGVQLVHFSTSTCYAIAVALVTYTAWVRAQHSRVASIAGLAALGLSLSNLSIRTQSFATVLFALDLAALWRWPGRKRLIAILMISEMLWTNLHGTFPLGVVLPGLFAAGTAANLLLGGQGQKTFADRNFQIFAACAAASFAAMFANPMPGRTLSYVTGVATKAASRGIEEWAATDFSSYAGVAFFISLVTVAALVARIWQHLSPTDGLLLAVFAALGFKAQRMVIWWGLAMPTVIAPMLHALVFSRGRIQPSKRESFGPLLFAFALGALLVMSTPWTRAHNPLLPPAKRASLDVTAPQAATRFLAQHANIHRLFNPMEWGGFVTWQLESRIKVFIDPRIDFFPDKIWNDYLAIGHARAGWEAKLINYGIDAVLWDVRLGDALPNALNRSTQWREVMRDQMAVVYTRVPMSAIPNTGQVH